MLRPYRAPTFPAAAPPLTLSVLKGEGMGRGEQRPYDLRGTG